VLESEETQKDAQIGPLHIRIRPDRIDNVADGEVILDYKTGLCSLTAWQGQRPDEPQLLLYATQRNPNTLRGIAFAQIRAGGMKLLEQPADANKVDEWRTVLEELAVEFHQGVADVAPKHFPKTCEHCEQQPFCRVAEINLASTEDTSYDNSD
jgi:RecB family exonuclease